MRSLAETQARWQATRNHSTSVADLQRAVRSNGSSSPCLSGCRSVCWKIFLLSRDGMELGWSQSLREGRERYSERRDHFLKFIKHPEALTELTIDPLTDDPESPWNTVREDEVIREEILQDVRRLPDEANYHEDHIQLMILDVLFIYCKANPDRGGYRQGMHELLAPIVHAIDQDALNRTAVPPDEVVDELMLETIDSSFIEHDAYVLFSQLMEHAQAFYEVRDVTSRPADSPSTPRFPEQSSAIVERSKIIHEVCLQKIDPELAVHLTNIEILPQIFLIRWIRLLFSREFPFNQFLVLWDTIFAIDPSLDLIDLVCCAMLIRIRWQLLESDYSICLQLLLRYPPPVQPYGPQTFVDDALYLRDHLDTEGAASLISKYTGKLPKIPKSPEPHVTTSPFSGLDSIRRKGLTLRSPVRSPSRFLQQQGGVENIFQGVLERGEKLGINQAVRGAMGELKRNMQGLNEARHSTHPPRPGLTDESAAIALAAMERRNRQLAAFLNETVMSLKAVSMSDLEHKAKGLELIGIAAAKIQFVQIYLEDASMEVPVMNSSDVDGRGAAKTKSRSGSIAGKSLKKENEPVPSAGPAETNVSAPSHTENEQSETTPLRADKLPNNDDAHSSDAVDTSGDNESTEELLEETPLKAQVSSPMPARSTLAQSSFSWMLESDESGPTKMPLAGKSSQAHNRKRGANNVSREKNAFLFGEAASTDGGGGDPLGSGDMFGMEPIQRAAEKSTGPGPGL